MPPNAIPIHIVTGFLGSGKTTLMNRLLKELPAGSKPALIINDFGDVPLDGELIKEKNYAIKELSSGCVCCTLIGPLEESITALVKDQKPDLLIMETTGVADPNSLLKIFATNKIAELIHVGNVYCVIDSNTFLKYEANLPIFSAQVKSSNIIIINKTDLPSKELLEKTRQKLSYYSAVDSIIITAKYGEYSIKNLLTERPLNLNFPKYSLVAAEHHFESHSVEDEKIYNSAKLEKVIKNLGEKILRAKGIVKTEQGNKLFHLTLSGLTMETWTGQIEKNRMAFIGEKIDSKKIEYAISKSVEGNE